MIAALGLAIGLGFAAWVGINLVTGIIQSQGKTPYQEPKITRPGAGPCVSSGGICGSYETSNEQLTREVNGIIQARSAASYATNRQGQDEEIGSATWLTPRGAPEPVMPGDVFAKRDSEEARR